MVELEDGWKDLVLKILNLLLLSSQLLKFKVRDLKEKRRKEGVQMKEREHLFLSSYSLVPCFEGKKSNNLKK